MKPRRIMYLEANEDGTVGGSHRQLHDLVKFIDRSRYEPLVVFNQDNVYVNRIRTLGCEVHVLEDIRRTEYDVHVSGSKFAKTLEIFRAIHRRRKFLKEHRVELVHVNNSPAVGNDDWLPACRMLGIPIIASAMGDAGGVEGRLHGILFRSFNRVLPVSRYIEKGMRDFGVPQERLVMVHHGVDLQKLRARVTRPPEEVRAELGVAEDEVLAAMVGNVREWKGQHVVVEGLGLLPPHVRDRLRVVFAGSVREEDEPFHARVLERVKALDLESMIDFLGHREDVPDIFNAADIAIHSSVKPEPGGIVVLEALTLGAAVIAASRGGHTEAMTEETGRIFNTDHPEQLAERITELVENPELRRSMAERAKVEIENFAIEKHVDRVSAVYDELLS